MNDDSVRPSDIARWASLILVGNNGIPVVTTQPVKG